MLSDVAVVGIATNVVVWVGVRALLGLYPGYGLNRVEELRRQTLAVAATLAIVSVFALAFRIGDSLSRLLLVAGFLSLLLLAPLSRHFAKRGIRRMGLWGKPVVVLGDGNSGANLIRGLKKEWELGYRPVAFFDNRQAPVGGTIEGVPYGGTVAAAVELAHRQQLDTAIFAMPPARRSTMIALIDRASASFPHVVIVPNLGVAMASAVAARDLAGTLGIEIRHNLLSPLARRTKRALDLFGVVVGGLLISPLLLALIVLIKLNSPGPAFYAQQRMGSGRRHFRCWKFRTMRTDADSLLTDLLRSDAELRSEWERNHKLRSDPRVTRIGGFLRKTSLDELPQLWNVLRGEMSLVGPRPIVDAEVPKYGDAYALYQKVMPGITGLWQVSGRSDTSYDERVAMDANYVRDWSVWLDAIILVRTIGSVFFARGAA
jgi:Undecaprenyl-phosphate galactose phosphotransferase WbaP